MTYKLTWSEAKEFEEGTPGIDVIGVYLIGFRDTATNKRHVVYVGKGHIGDRLAQQYRRNSSVRRELSRPGRVGYYRFAAVADEEDRLDIELALYRRYGGNERLCNTVEPAGSGREQEVEVVEVFPPKKHSPPIQTIQKSELSHQGLWRENTGH